MMIGPTPEVERSLMLSEDDVKRTASHVRTKKRVSDHGEVLTGQREVNAMLDLVKQETERIDSRFLEPACGDGNFLTVILGRKLEFDPKLALASANHGIHTARGNSAIGLFHGEKELASISARPGLAEISQGCHADFLNQRIELTFALFRPCHEDRFLHPVEIF